MTATGEVPRGDRKTSILAAAAELFAAQGFAGTGIDEIGARAGITGPAIYRHFQGKGALLQGVVERALVVHEPSDATIAAGLEAMTRHAVAAALQDPAFLVTYLRERHRLDDQARHELERTERRLFRRWRDAMRAVNPDLQADEAARRHRAVFAAIGDTASRTTPVPHLTLERLLGASAVAVLSQPPLPQSPPAPASDRWSVPPSRRDLILGAAMSLFRERGFHGVSMDEIGAAAGVTGPTIYFHYGSKLDVLAAAHERASMRTWVAVHDAVEEATSASDALNRLAGAQLRVAADHGDLIVVTTRELPAPAPADRERFEQRAVEIVDLWVAVVGELRPDLARSELRAVVTGVFPLMNHTAHWLGRPGDGIALVRAWALGSTSTSEAVPDPG